MSKTKKQKCIHIGKSALKLTKKRGIYIPPSYTNVSVSCDENEKLQATAKDKSGKVQYFYTKRHKEHASAKKWMRLRDFIEQIPKIRKYFDVILNDVKSSDKDKALALGVKLMDTCNFRVGGQSKKTYGASTLKKNHLKSNSIEYIGKSGVTNKCEIDREFMRLIKNIYIPHKPSFQYFNKELKRFGNFTCKDFRSFKANAIFVDVLFELENKKKTQNQKERDNNIKTAIVLSANKMHHTPSICKGSYLLPFVIESYRDGLMKLEKKELNRNYITVGESILWDFLNVKKFSYIP
jgi:DNA topoisomerase-1